MTLRSKQGNTVIILIYHMAILTRQFVCYSGLTFLQSLLCSDHSNCMTSHSLVQCHMYEHVDTGYTVTCIYIDQSHTIEITITCIVQHDVMCKGSLTSSMFLSHLETLVNVLSFVTTLFPAIQT